MKKYKIALFVLLCSCVVDEINKVGVVKNFADYNISVVYSTQPSLSDEELFYMGKISVPARSATEINGNSVGNNLYFFFFNEDSVYRYIKMGKIQEIVSHSFLGKVYVNYENKSINDTIFFKP